MTVTMNPEESRYLGTLRMRPAIYDLGVDDMLAYFAAVGHSATIATLPTRWREMVYLAETQTDYGSYMDSLAGQAVLRDLNAELKELDA